MEGNKAGGDGVGPVLQLMTLVSVYIYKKKAIKIKGGTFLSTNSVALLSHKITSLISAFIP